MWRILRSQNQNRLSGEDAFRLYDSTYGFPLELTKRILAEEDMEVDIKEFAQRMDEQRQGWKREGTDRLLGQ